MVICPFATWRPVVNHGGRMTAHQGLVLHVQVGNNSCFGEFDTPANQVSSTWWVGASGQLEQYVDADLIAWAQMSGNPTWNSVETEGFPTAPLTEAQVVTLARLYAWGHQVYGWPYHLAETPDENGFGWHGMGSEAWGHPLCPGVIRRAQRATILTLAAISDEPHLTPPPPPTVIPYPHLPEGATVSQILVPVGLDADGNGSIILNGGSGVDESGVTQAAPAVEWATVVAWMRQGSNPPVDGYWEHTVGAQDHQGFTLVTVTGGPASGEATAVVTVTP